MAVAIPIASFRKPLRGQVIGIDVLEFLGWINRTDIAYSAFVAV
jgi:hypothetical protein